MNDVPDATMYVTSLREILWGVMLVAITLTLHGFGMILTLRVNNAFKRRLERIPSFALGVFSLILASWMIILVQEKLALCLICQLFIILRISKRAATD